MAQELWRTTITRSLDQRDGPRRARDLFEHIEPVTVDGQNRLMIYPGRDERVEGWQHGSIHANGIAIDLSESQSALKIEEIADWNLQQEVDWAKPAQVFRFYIQYNRLGVTFGYNLLAELVEGTHKIRCAFSALTDLPFPQWRRDRSIVPVALPADLSPLVIRSGQAIAISTYPVGEDKPAVVHYIRLTRMDAAHGEEAKTE